MFRVFAAHMTAVLMRSTDRLPIIPAGLRPMTAADFFGPFMGVPPALGAGAAEIDL
jgi:hypothetical protein